MRDPLTWALPFGRVFGITVRVHLLFPILFVGLVLQAALKKAPEGATPYPSGLWIDMTMILGLLFVAVLLHEFGHCYGARLVEGDASEVLLWPLGGLAFCDVPHTPRANFVTTLFGPLVNVVLFLSCGLLLAVLPDEPLRPPMNPIYAPFRTDDSGAVLLTTWAGGQKLVTNLGWVVLARFFWVNWFLALLNLVLVGFPLDGGRLLQAGLWKYVGYRQATFVAVMAGFVVAIVVAIVGIALDSVLPLCLALFIGFSCRNQWYLLETGGEESLFGYDFSQGYTSLERDQPPPPPRRRQSWFQRWRQRRAQQRMLREQELRESEERRLDELLEKVQRDGLAALTDEERRFLKRASDRYRHRQ